MGFGRFGRRSPLIRGGGGTRRGIGGLVLHLSIINSLRGREGERRKKKGEGGGEKGRGRGKEEREKGRERGKEEKEKGRGRERRKKEGGEREE